MNYPNGIKKQNNTSEITYRNRGMSLESDLNEDYVAYCNKVLLNLNYIDEPLNENGLKLFILFRQEYLFTDEDVKYGQRTRSPIITCSGR